MTYAAFHLYFTVPPILALAAWLAWRHPRELKFMGPGIALICVIAVLYTTPWDNYLVYKSVWGYGPDRVLATIGYVPVEEYAFFVLQTILTGLVLTWASARRRYGAPPAIGGAAKSAVSVVLLGIAIFGGLGLMREPTLYLGLILAWAFPVLLMQWLIGARFIAHEARTWTPVVAVTTVYLCFADATAIGAGTWYISERYTTGLHILDLPIEEALFFLVTNLLVVWGLLLYRAFRTTSARPRP